MQPDTAKTLRDHVSPDKIAQIAREYEDFAYIVSHDLNAPLRHVKEFSRLLIAGRKDHLNDEEQTYVAFLNTSLEKIESMQKALLDFSRLGTRSGTRQKTNMNDVVGACLQEFKEPHVLEYKKLPSATVNSAQIHLLFSCLIDNCLKFHKKNVMRKKICINATTYPDCHIFEIQDNGIGIAPEYHEEVFRMFRRLEPEKYPGIGAGLTLARKIVRLHDGEIWINSAAGKGTSVLFSLPK